jgi:hypothetical protein
MGYRPAGYETLQHGVRTRPSSTTTDTGASSCVGPAIPADIRDLFWISPCAAAIRMVAPIQIVALHHPTKLHALGS